MEYDDNVRNERDTAHPLLIDEVDSFLADARGINAPTLALRLERFATRLIRSEHVSDVVRETVSVSISSRSSNWATISFETALSLNTSAVEEVCHIARLVADTWRLANKTFYAKVSINVKRSDNWTQIDINMGWCDVL